MSHPSPAPSAADQQRTNFRWVICSLLFFSTTVNYMDRNVIGYLKEFYCTPAAQGGFGWTNTDFSYLTSFFTAFYAGMTIAAGYGWESSGWVGCGLALAGFGVWIIAVLAARKPA